MGTINLTFYDPFGSNSAQNGQSVFSDGSTGYGQKVFSLGNDNNWYHIYPGYDGGQIASLIAAGASYVVSGEPSALDDGGAIYYPVGSLNGHAKYQSPSGAVHCARFGQQLVQV